MAASEDKNQTQAPMSVEAEIQEDIWLYRGRGWSKNARWFALSTVAHVLLLSLLATLSITIVQKRQDMIKVQALPLSSEDQQQQQDEADKPPEDWEGEPSLKEIPGLLTMEQVTPKSTKTTVPREGEAPQAVRPAALPPIMNGIGPSISVGPSRLDNIFPTLGNLSGAIGGIG